MLASAMKPRKHPAAVHGRRYFSPPISSREQFKWAFAPTFAQKLQRAVRAT